MTKSGMDGQPVFWEKKVVGGKVVVFQQTMTQFPDLNASGSGVQLLTIDTFAVRLVMDDKTFLDGGCLDSDGNQTEKPVKKCKSAVGSKAWDAVVQELRNFLIVRQIMES